MHDAKITHSGCDNKVVQVFEIIISILNAEVGKCDFVHSSNTVNNFVVLIKDLALLA